MGCSASPLPCFGDLFLCALLPIAILLPGQPEVRVERCVSVEEILDKDGERLSRRLLVRLSACVCNHSGPACPNTLECICLHDLWESLWHVDEFLRDGPKVPQEVLMDLFGFLDHNIHWFPFDRGFAATPLRRRNRRVG